MNASTPPSRFKRFFAPLCACCVVAFLAYASQGDQTLPAHLAHPFRLALISTLIPCVLWIVPLIFEARPPKPESLPKLRLRTVLCAGLFLFFGTDALSTVLAVDEPQALVAIVKQLSLFQKIVLGCVIAGIVPVIEEIIFRRLLPNAFGIHAAALFFALAHGIPQLYPPLLFFAYTLLFLRQATGRIWPGMILHGLFNLTTLVLI